MSFLPYCDPVTIRDAKKGEPQLPDPGSGLADTFLELPAHRQVLLLTHPSFLLLTFPLSVHAFESP